MVINAITSNKISKLLFKKIEQQINRRTVYEQGLSFFAPENAVTYDFISGIGKKGKFSIFSFKDADGNLICRGSRYLKDGNHCTDILTDYEKKGDVFNITRKTINDRFCDKIEYSSIQRINEQNYRKSYMTRTINGDFGGWDVLRQRQKPCGIKFDYNWDGKPSIIEYNNTQGLKLNLTEEESQYLPFLPQKFPDGTISIIGTDFTAANAQNKINLAQIIQERFQRIKEGVLPKAKGMRHDDMLIVRQNYEKVKTMKANGQFYEAEAQGNGQINLAIDVPNGAESHYILRRMAHEIQHQKDRIKSFCGGKEALIDALKEFEITSEETIKKYVTCLFEDNKELYNRCISEYGICKKGTQEYNEAVQLWKERINTLKHSYKTKAEHDAIPWEKRAVDRETEQSNLIRQITTKINHFLSQI